MADHTIVNLQDVEDAAEKFGMPPGLEARFARSALGLEKSGVTLFKAGPDFKVPWGHRHRDQEEVYLVLARQRDRRLRGRASAELRRVGRGAHPRATWRARSRRAPTARRCSPSAPASRATPR